MSKDDANRLERCQIRLRTLELTLGVPIGGRVMVDELRVWTDEGLFSRGSCHLTADNLDDLHAFAARIGMRRQWFQSHPIAPHYDLTPDRRAYALRMGAVFVPIRVQLASRREARAG